MLIGFAGPAGVGKTTIANKLSVHRNFSVEAFATPLKEALVALTGLPMAHFRDIDLKEQLTVFGKTPRKMMQLLGTELARNMIHKEFHVIRMEQRLNWMRGVDVVIDDVRFEDEAALIRKRGGVVFHLTREFASPTVEVSHASENGIIIKPEDICIHSGDRNVQWTFDQMIGGLYEKGYID